MQRQLVYLILFASTISCSNYEASLQSISSEESPLTLNVDSTSQAQTLPGDLIVVGSGVYNTVSSSSSLAVLHLIKGGTSTKRISIKSEKKWGAIIDAGGRHSSVIVQCDALPSPVSYVRLDGFIIRNAAEFGVMVKDANAKNGQTRCSNLEFTNLKIYSIKGYAGIEVENVKNSLIASNLIYSIGSLSGNETRRHDHGIYVSDYTEDILIKNTCEKIIFTVHMFNYKFVYRFPRAHTSYRPRPFYRPHTKLFSEA